MNRTNNQLHQETERRLREALFYYMESGREPSVNQLCTHAGINRSTFYRHYQDVPDLMEKTEAELQKGLASILSDEEGNEGKLLERMVSYIGQYQRFYRIYLQKSNHSFETGILKLWDSRLRSRFEAAGVHDEKRMNYYYQFVRAGVVQVLKIWIDGGCRESAGEISGILRSMLGASSGRMKNR